ncbi:MAG TPA: ABC transporter permease [Bryobacteraceae bacterium]|nr:ABC transporter permease [Bryobacteraceae bacterium]
MSLIRRFRLIFKPNKHSSELDEEMQFHLAMREQFSTEDGMPAEEARFDAQRRFGNKALLKERTREIDVFTFFETIFQDLQFAARMIAKNPGFTAVAILALAVGIGVNTAVFTAYEAVLLKPIDGKNPRQLVNIYRTSISSRYDDGFSYPDYEYYATHAREFSGLIAAGNDELTLTGASGSVGSATGGVVASAFGFQFPQRMGRGAELVLTVIVSDSYFSVLGVNAVQGRVFLPADAHELIEHPAVLISQNYWERRFNSDPAILGKSLKVNGAPFTVMGITPKDFMGTNVNVPDFWMPIDGEPLVHRGNNWEHAREQHCCRLYGRLRPGHVIEEAQAEMAILSEQVRGLHAPDSNDRKPSTISLLPGGPFGHGREKDEQLRAIIAFILSAVGLVLLIACANVASMQLARSAARQREIGVRLSLGASRGRLIRQLLTESALLGLLAGIVALIATWWSLRILLVEISAALPIEWGSLALHLEPDIHVFAYVFAISLFAGILFGMAPALESSRLNLTSALKEEGAGFALRLRSARLRDILIALQVSVCLFLLICAGLLIRGSIRSLQIDPGYAAKRVLSLDVNFPSGLGYTDAKRLAEVHQLHDRIQPVPGVQSVIFATTQPAAGGLRITGVRFNSEKPPADSPEQTLYYSYIAPNYFTGLSIPIELGRTFTSQEVNVAAPVIILSESAAKQLWPNADPIGKRVYLDATDQYHGDKELFPHGASYQVVGVAKDIRGILLDHSDSRFVYLPLPRERWNNAGLMIRTAGDPKSMMNAIAQQIHSVDPNLIVYAETLDGLFTATPAFVFSRLAAIFATIIGMLGLSLASVGIYGMVGYAVVRRTREMGIRRALGAQRFDLLKLILVESTRPVVYGLVGGIAAAAGVSTLLRSLLSGLSPMDAMSFGGVSAFFLAVALLAAYLPARRATRIDPMTALRYE